MSGKKRDTSVVEFSITSIILGVLLAVLFGGANAYLGLRVGMTVSASIPAAVISMGIIRVLLRKDSILESNMVQTIGSAGESVAAGAIFTLPVLFMWAEEGISGFPGYMEITAICICASILGILFMVPLRNALIVKEHMTLPYPEGTACAKVLVAGKEKKSEASWVFIGLVIAGIYKFIVDGVRLFGSQIHYEFKKLKGAGIGVDVLPALISVGYICGFRIASFMLAGGIISWLALMPVISMFGNDIVLFPGDVLIGSMTSNQLWSNYIRYIGAGAVAAAGIISLVKSLPMLCNAFVSSFSKENRKFQAEGGRSERNIPMKWIIILVAVISLFIWLTPNIPVNFLGTILIIIFGFCYSIFPNGGTGGKQQQSGVRYDHCNIDYFSGCNENVRNGFGGCNDGNHSRRFHYLYYICHCRRHFPGSENRIYSGRHTDEAADWGNHRCNCCLAEYQRSAVSVE